MYVILDGSLIFHSENLGRYSGTVVVMRIKKKYILSFVQREPET